jgi:PGDYG protein
MPLFRSTGVPGYSSAVRQHPDHQSARKREQPIQVRFATSDCLIDSQEGSVHAKAGDAILTGVHGEHWRVSKAHFADKYRPVAPTRPGEDGIYVSNAIPVLAVKMQEPFEVLLADGRSKLSGARGDWLVDYGDGSLGIVSEGIFPMTYEILS